MSAFGAKADVIKGVAEGPLTARSGHMDTTVRGPKSSQIGHAAPPESVQISVGMGQMGFFDIANRYAGPKPVGTFAILASPDHPHFTED